MKQIQGGHRFRHLFKSVPLARFFLPRIGKLTPYARAQCLNLRDACAARGYKPSAVGRLALCMLSSAGGIPVWWSTGITPNIERAFTYHEVDL